MATPKRPTLQRATNPMPAQVRAALVERGPLSRLACQRETPASCSGRTYAFAGCAFPASLPSSRPWTAAGGLVASTAENVSSTLYV